MAAQGMQMGSLIRWHLLPKEHIRGKSESQNRMKNIWPTSTDRKWVSVLWALLLILWDLLVIWITDCGYTKRAPTCVCKQVISFSHTCRREHERGQTCDSERWCSCAVTIVSTVIVRVVCASHNQFKSRWSGCSGKNLLYSVAISKIWVSTLHLDFL